MTTVMADTFDGLRELPLHPAAYFGPGARHRLIDALRTMGSQRILFVHGHASLDRCGMSPVVDRIGSGLRIARLIATPNPDLGAVRAGVAAVRDFRPDAVVGIGGGSAMDLAKAVTVLAAQRGDPSAESLAAVPLLPRRANLVLVPTTGGSGSELTQLATVYDGERKLSLDADVVRSDLSLIDPELSRSVPPVIAAAAGADALGQAIESYWAVNATTGSRAVAWQAFEILVAALDTAVSHDTWSDPDLVAARALGAALSGAAISMTRTTAAHAFSYALTSRLGIAHGLAVALHLRWLLAFNAEVTTDDCLRADGAAATAADVARLDSACLRVTDRPLSTLLADLLSTGHQPSSIHDLALDPSTWAASWVEAAGSARARNNPRRVSADDLHRVANGEVCADV